MHQTNITNLRAHLPDYLKKVRLGEQIQITNHGKVIARLIPESDEVELAQKRLDKLRGTMIQGDIIDMPVSNWSADIDNL
ncbi:MAG: type II toxin-antitoxin system prevent-host-death family antitoxin [Methylococcales bacterium]|jgi:prevent-host-death family protein|nr:type II toxin-antitoxin system prevent-host-death family antitoxin [Methylococcales bacterium]MBT7411061.1 type II toxin-antitoxin system prevent-host-death family antitoxin [Methylococcales bacterium]